MEILIDTNVLLNFLTNREDPFLKESIEVVNLCTKDNINGNMAFHSLSTLWYVLRKRYSDIKVRTMLYKLCGFINVSAASQKQIMDAIKNENFKDFEDCLQDECAVSVDADYIVTCNSNDFRFSETPVMNPKEFVEFINGDEYEI